MHLNFLTTTFYSLTIHLLSFPAGYLLLHCISRNRLTNIPFFVRYPLYISIGLSFLGIISWLIILPFVNGYILLFISLICWVIILFNKLNRKEITIRHLINFNEFLPLTLFAILFLHFSFIVGYYKWPPVGDILSHGRTVSYLISSRRGALRGFSYFIYYPFSFHALSAYLSLLLGTYPGETVFLLGATIVTVIPMMFYSLTFTTTKSKSIALIPFIGSLVYEKTNLERWFIGYFYNGPYPNLWGFLVFFTFFAICCLKEYFMSKKNQFMILFILTLHMYATYFPFVPFNVLCILLSEYKTIIKVFKKKNRWSIILLLTLIILFYSGIIAFDKIVELHNLKNIMEFYKLSMPKFTFMSGYTINFYITILSVPVALYLLVKRKYPTMPLSYVIIISILILSTLHPTFHSFFYPILPSRSFMIVSGLSWIVLSLFIHSISNSHMSLNLKALLIKRDRLIIIPKTFIPLTFIIISILFFPIYSLPPINSIRGLGWFILSEYPDNFATLEWIHNNVPAEDIILGDASFASQFIHSFSAKGPFGSLYLVGKYAELRSIWRSPENKTLVINLLRKYNISYVFVSSEWGWWDHGYRSKPRTPIQYIKIFDNYSFLQIMFKNGNSAVYKVNLLNEQSSSYTNNTKNKNVYNCGIIVHHDPIINSKLTSPDVKRGKDTINSYFPSESFPNFITKPYRGSLIVLRRFIFKKRLGVEVTRSKYSSISYC